MTGSPHLVGFKDAIYCRKVFAEHHWTVRLAMHMEDLKFCEERLPRGCLFHVFYVELFILSVQCNTSYYSTDGESNGFYMVRRLTQSDIVHRDIETDISFHKTNNWNSNVKVK